MNRKGDKCYTHIKNNLYKREYVCYNIFVINKRGISAVGSASHWQCEGQGFKSLMLHKKERRGRSFFESKRDLKPKRVFAEKNSPVDYFLAKKYY